MIHFGLLPAVVSAVAVAEPAVTELAVAEPMLAGALTGVEVDALFARQEGTPEPLRGKAAQPARPGADEIDAEAELRSEEPSLSEDPLEAWAESRLADFRQRGIEAVSLEESRAFVEELRAREASEFLSEALLYLGYSRMYAGELEEAIAEWREAARLGAVWGRPRATAKAQNALGIGYRQGGDLITARKHFELAVLYSQGDEAKGFRVNLASCEMGLGNLGRAFDQFASVVNELSDAQACVAYYNLSGICLTAELFEAAVRLSERCLAQYDLAQEQVQRIAGSTIGVQLLLHHAECLTSFGDLTGAEAALARAEEEQSALGEIPPWARGELLSRKASIAVQNESFEEALEILAPLARDLARSGRPPHYLDPHVQRLLATALEGTGQLREALDILDQVDPSQVTPGSYLELDLNELRMSIWGKLAESLAASEGGAGSLLGRDEAEEGDDPSADAAWVARNHERRDWRHAERSIIQANFARPELAPLLGDLAALQGTTRGLTGGAGFSGAGGGEGRASRSAALVALVFAGLLAVGSLVLGVRAKRRAQKVLQLESLVEELRDQRREVADRAAAVSHDLRAPVLALRCCLDLLGLDEASPNVRNRIEPMRKGLDHIIRLADDSLLLHGLPGREGEPQGELCDLGEVLKPVIDLWRPMAARKQLELRFDVAPGPHLWSIDEDHAVRMLENLLSNAVKFAEGPGAIEVSLATEDGFSQLSVTDCGPGLPEHELPRLFEPMARLSVRPTDDEVSSGLGTSIVRALAERNGGRVRAVNNASGRGLTVSVRWPAHLDVEAASPIVGGARAASLAELPAWEARGTADRATDSCDRRAPGHDR
ncbi:MAG: ATP-binding protein [Planctomycetota bacterium]|jgi:signal transduction histidine kinase